MKWAPMRTDWKRSKRETSEVRRKCVDYAKIVRREKIMEKAHKKLKAWQEAMGLVRITYEMTSSLPPEEKFGLQAQMRRAAISVPSNIAEGAARRTSKDSIQFYVIARGSLSELDTQTELCLLLNLLKPENLLSLTKQIEKVDSLLSGLIRFKRSNKETI
jgi:four helix bundle protein